MIDLHTHILPGVDDGVRTEDEAVAFARVACADGVRVIVATPHCREGFFVNERGTVIEQVGRLEARLRQEGLVLELLPGAEVHLCPDLVQRIRDGRATTLGDNGRTLLLELSLSQYPVEIESLVFELRLAGIDVVLAHPERIRYFQDDVRRLESLVQQGAYGQLTTGSVLGVFGSAARECSEELLCKGLVHVLASDAHGVEGGRSPRLSGGVEACLPWVGESYARSMVATTPRALLDGRTPELPALDGTAARRRSVFLRWFGRG